MKDDTVSRRAALDALEKEKPTPFVNKDGSVDLFDAGRQNQWYRDGIAIMKLPSTQPKRKTCGLECLRCKKTYDYSWDTMDEISYTMYSYCPDCIRKGIQLLKSQDKEGAQE